MNLFAYLDPGTGSIILQAVIGVGVALIVAIKTYWHKISKLFGKKTSNTKHSEDLRNE